MSAEMTHSLASSWLALPAPLRERLSMASTGWRHLAATGALALGLSARAGGEERRALAELATDILLWSFGENPLSGPLAAELLAASGLELPESSRRVLSAVGARWRLPAPTEGLAYFERLAAKRDTERLADFLAGQIDKDPAGLFWRDKALGLGIYCGPGELGARLTSAALSGLDALPELAPVALCLAAQDAFLRGDAEGCGELLSGLPPVFGPAFAPARAALAHLSVGEDHLAMPGLLRALGRAPWQAGLARTAADSLCGVRKAIAPPPGPVLVALYTWNKAQDLDATLASLFDSNLGGARVLVLDNGSTDDTPQVLDAWAERIGEGMERAALPVNIGAPAARNWIIASPQARAAGSVAFVDDDVDLPRDWLLRLGAALEIIPGAGVAGCKVADHQAPRLLQNVGGLLVVPEGEGDDRPDVDFRSLTPNPFRLLDAHLQGPDWGFFDHLGECASVTGCCHLFRREALEQPFEQGGGFSLALGPSQYDDFERDLRMLSTGRRAAYQGHLRVRHRKRSGLAAQGAAGEENGGQAASASANGNRYKMQTMHPRAEVARFISDQAQALGDAVGRAFALADAVGDLV